MLLRTLLIGLIITFTGCAQQMTHEEFNSIKKVAVITRIKDELYFYNRGLTIFENKAINANISDWKLSNYLTKRIITDAHENAPSIEFIQVPYEFKNRQLSVEDKNILVEKLKAEGFDTMIGIGNAGIYSASGGGYYLVPPEIGGFIFYTTSVFGNDLRNQICPQFSLEVFRLSDMKLLSNSSNNMRYPEPIKTVEAKPFDLYTDNEKSIIKTELEKNIDDSAKEVVKNIFTIKQSE